MTSANDSTDYVARHHELPAGLASLSDAIAPTMSGFGELHRSTMAGGALDAASKELISLAERAGSVATS